jgi:hypothetical protein
MHAASCHVTIHGTVSRKKISTTRFPGAESSTYQVPNDTSLMLTLFLISVSDEQVLTTVLAHMVPDYLSPERMAARENLHRAISGVVNSMKIASFCRR